MMTNMGRVNQDILVEIYLTAQMEIDHLPRVVEGTVEMVFIIISLMGHIHQYEGMATDDLSTCRNTPRA